MKNVRPWLYALICLLLVVLCYFWATGLMDTLYAYRSPLKDSPPQPGPALGSPLVRRLLLVHVDGLRLDVAANPQYMPFLNELRQQGAAAVMHSRPPSYSHPAYSTLFTGAWPDFSDGPAMNLDDPETIPLWTQDNLFAAVKRAGLKLAVSDYRLFDRFLPPGALDATYYSPVDELGADQAVLAAALPWLQSSEYAFTLVHLNQVDHASHYNGGPLSPDGLAAAALNDQYLRQMVSQLDLEKDAVIIFSDHGHLDVGGHGGHEELLLVEPFVIAGAGVKPGAYGDIQMVDLAPTAAALLGANLPASSQGRVLTEMLELSPAQLDAIRMAESRQQAGLLAAYQQTPCCPGWLAPFASYIQAPLRLSSGQDEARPWTVESAQAALEASRQRRMALERLPRFLLAGLIFGFGLYLIWKNRSAGLAWDLLGALIYLVLFNLRFGVTSGRTYSLSTVASAADIINFVAGTAGTAFLLAWVIVALRRRWFAARPAAAALEVFHLTFVTLFLVGLPALWSFAWNGPLVTWSLPDVASMFLGFLAILQMLVIAALGPLLALLTSGLAHFLHR